MPGLEHDRTMTLLFCAAALAAALAAGCGQTPDLLAPASPTPFGQPPGAAATPTQPAPSLLPASPTPAGGSAIPPRTDPTPGTPAEIARSALAARLGVASVLVTLVSEGAWTADPIACELDLPARSEHLIQGQHKQVMLIVKDRTYEVWVFESVGGVPLAFPCSTP
ncbi:MAG: hypothetical protein IT318_16770 [Anaerolineales bacterium]|nr:hypothetical protein [Anaerolineales bacterium]